MVDESSYLLICGCLVVWSEPWTVIEDRTGYNEEFESDYVVLQNGEGAEFILRMTKADGRAPADLIDESIGISVDLDDADVLDRSHDDTHAIAVLQYEDAAGETLGKTTYAKTYMDYLLFVSLSSPTSDWDANFASVEESVFALHDAPFADVEPEYMADLLSAGASQSDDPPKTNSNANTQGDDQEALGLVGTRRYESPQFGYEATWSRDWELDTYYDEPIVSDEEAVQDSLYLVWSEDEDTPAYLTVFGFEAQQVDAADMVETWESAAFLEEQFPDHETEVVLADDARDRGSVVYRQIDTETDAEIVTVYEVVMLDDGETMVLLSVSSEARNFEEALAAANADIEIAEEAPFTTFDGEEIEEALAA